MIEEFLLWLELISRSDLQNLLEAQSQSNVIFIAYIVTIRKSYLFGVAFLFCEVLGKSGFISTSLDQSIYGLVFYCAYLLTWLSVASLHIRQTSNKNTLICCAIMILFLSTMAWDSYINAYTETFIWRNYENIILLIHVCIIISLYKPRAIIDGLVGKLINAINLLRNNYACLYFWYTIRNWQINKRLL